MEQPAGPVQTTPHLSPVLTQENTIYTIFDQQQREHAFRRKPNGDFYPLGSTSGDLVQITNHQFQWIEPSGKRHLFMGSTLASSGYINSRAHRPEHDNQSTKGQQDPSRLTGVQKPLSARLGECSPHITHLPGESDTDPAPSSDHQASVTVTDPTQQLTQEPNTQPTGQTAEQPLSTDESPQCDIDASGPHSFQPVPYSGPQTTLDARPQSCESYFVQYYGTHRGFEIESGLQLHSPYDTMQATLRTFPVIDFIDDSTLYVVHSRDLGNRTFNSPARPDALFEQLMDDGEDIQTRFVNVVHEHGSISASELGQTTTISADQLKPITLQLVIRDGIASAEHWEQIARAREELMLRHGVTLEVVILP